MFRGIVFDDPSQIQRSLSEACKALCEDELSWIKGYASQGTPTGNKSRTNFSEKTEMLNARTNLGPDQTLHNSPAGDQTKSFRKPVQSAVQGDMASKIHVAFNAWPKRPATRSV